MPSLAYHTPTTVDEAVALLSGEPGAKPLAGGTDLIVQMKSGRGAPAAIVDLKKIAALSGVRQHGEDAMWTEVLATRIDSADPVSVAVHGNADVRACVHDRRSKRVGVGWHRLWIDPAEGRVPLGTDLRYFVSARAKKRSGQAARGAVHRIHNDP